MDQRQIEQAVERGIMPLRIVSMAFASTLAVYALVGWLLIYQFEIAPIAELPLAVIAAIVGAGLSTVLISFPIRASILARDLPPAAEPAMLLQRYIKASVVSFAMAEVAAVVGLLISLLTGNIAWLLALVGVSLAAMAVNWPRRDAIVDWLQLHGATR